MSRQFIYHMRGLSKTYPGNRKVLDNINLSFYPDAKIGVLGVNGSGKSTLLRIMAGIDTEFVGDGWVAEGARVGYLPQEPPLDEEKSVRENVMEGGASSRAAGPYSGPTRSPRSGSHRRASSTNGVAPTAVEATARAAPMRSWGRCAAPLGIVTVKEVPTPVLPPHQRGVGSCRSSVTFCAP